MRLAMKALDQIDWLDTCCHGRLEYGKNMGLCVCDTAVRRDYIDCRVAFAASSWSGDHNAVDKAIERRINQRNDTENKRLSHGDYSMLFMCSRKTWRFDFNNLPNLRVARAPSDARHVRTIQFGLRK